MALSTGQLHFTVDARHIRQLGRELVADRITALSELVKNAYDADATNVQIEFISTSAGPGGSLAITDDGSGMTLHDISERWMRISTDFKEGAPTSPRFARSRAGRKGIGRFAAESLGRRLKLESVVSGRRVSVIFDWENQYTPGASLETIANEYSVHEASGLQDGTTLRIEDLYEGWNESDISRVQRAILLLQPPFPTRHGRRRTREGAREADPGFHVGITLDGRSMDVSTRSLRDFLDAATATIEGSVDARGRGIWRVRSELLGLRAERRSDNSSRSCGSFTFKAAYYVYRKDAVGGIAVRLAQNMGNQYGGIRLYRDDLRILPYGERGNDWLSLDEQYRRRSTALFPLGNINFFGEVFVSQAETPLLIDTASREGVVENDAFRQLRNFVRDGLVWGASEVASLRAKRAPVKKDPKSAAELVDEALAAANAASVASDGEDRERAIAEVDRVRSSAAETDSERAAIQAQLISELNLLRILASLGTSLAVFSHEIRSALNVTESAVSDLEERLGADRQGPVELTGHLAAAQDSLERLRSIANFIDGFVSQSRRRLKQPQPVHTVSHEFFEAHRGLLSSRGIHSDVDVAPANIRTVPMARAELESVLMNLLSNAVKALDHPRYERKRISLSGRQEDSSLLLRFQDNGGGVSEEIGDKIFDAFITTSPSEEDILGTGTGLGLKIVADTVDAYGGSVKIAEADTGFSTCFEIRLPKWHPHTDGGE